MKDVPAAIFQVIFGALLLALAVALPISFIGRVALFFALWWSLLIVANSHAAIFHFEDQKQLFHELKTKEPQFMARTLLTIGYVFFWPIFLRKEVCLGLLVLFGLIYYGVRYFGQ